MDEGKLKGIVCALMTAYRDCRPDNVEERDSAKGVYVRKSDAGIAYAIGQSAPSYMRSAATMLADECDRYPADAAEEKLWKLILNAKDTCPALNVASVALANGVKLIADELEVLGDWECIALITGINPSELPLVLGGARFFVCTAQEFDALHDRFCKGEPSLASSMWNASLNGFGGIRQIIGHTVASVGVRAADAKHAQYSASLAIQQALDLLCYAQAVYGFELPFPEIGVQNSPRRTLAITMRQDVPELPTNQTIDAAYGLPVGLLQEIAPGVAYLAKVLESPVAERTELANRLLAATQWCA